MSPMTLLTRCLLALVLLTSWAAPAAAQQESVKPGINESWKSDDIDPLIGRLEAEDREIYAHRSAIATLVGPPPGSVVADVGAGSGFMVEEFARLVGPQGKVIALDINAAMMRHVSEEAAEKGLDNVVARVSGEREVTLEPQSVDIVFISDTYHHFEYPQSMMESIHRALRPGGQLIVVDFERIEGQSEDWVLQHVRAGREVFRQEIEAAGFQLVGVHAASFLKQNYVLRFLKK
ncbi:MAG TPA: class I SAM-dependent methyltransferase [Acidobacteriota bacterium]|nr:class I SAM-dependent methyltransferase [Acidobacteriota bacterium]